MKIRMNYHITGPVTVDVDLDDRLAEAAIYGPGWGVTY